MNVRIRSSILSLLLLLFSINCNLFDSTPPIIDITNPNTGDILSGNINIIVSASDTNDIEKVRIYIDETLAVEDSEFPYQFQWSTIEVEDGQYNISAAAWDSIGNKSVDDDTTVTVRNTTTPSIDDNTPPSINIIYPQNGDTVFGSVEINAIASDDNDIETVDFYFDSDSIDSDNNSPYSCFWDTTTIPDGEYLLKATASDFSGNENTDNDTTIFVNNSTVDSILPNINITSPSNGSTHSDIVNIIINATDNFAILKVEFYINDIFIDSDKSIPYSFEWDTRLYIDGLFNLSAKAIDTTGNVNIDNDTSVIVDNSEDFSRWDIVNWDEFIWE